jgi:hypothetical protein
MRSCDHAGRMAGRGGAVAGLGEALGSSRAALRVASARAAAAYGMLDACASCMRLSPSARVM